MFNDTTQTETRIAVVTGGSRGLGRSTVLSLARRAWLHSLPITPIVRQPKKLSPWWPKPVRRPSPCRSTSETRPPSMPSSIGCGNQA